MSIKLLGGGNSACKRFVVRGFNRVFCDIERFYWFIKRERLKMSLGEYGEGFAIDHDFKIPFPENVFIGNDVSLNERVRLSTSDSRIVIKDHVMFGPEVSVHGGDHRFDIVGRTIKSIDRNEKRPGLDDKDVVIEEDVWIGQGAVILMGVTIGRGCVIGARAIISKDTVPYGIYVGVNKLVGMRFTPEEIKEHERILYGE